jgi:hypothetical protein
MSFIVVQTNKIVNELQTYNRQGMNNKVADIVEGELNCCSNKKDYE